MVRIMRSRPRISTTTTDGSENSTRCGVLYLRILYTNISSIIAEFESVFSAFFPINNEAINDQIFGLSILDPKKCFARRLV